MVMKRCRWLYACQELAVLNQDEMAKVVESLSFRTYKAGEILFAEGKIVNRIFIIEEGKALISIPQEYQMLSPAERDARMGIVRPHASNTELVSSSLGLDSGTFEHEFTVLTTGNAAL